MLGGVRGTSIRFRPNILSAAPPEALHPRAQPYRRNNWYAALPVSSE